MLQPGHSRSKTSLLHWLGAGLGSLSLLLSHSVLGQSYPSKPIRIVVPFTSGGAADVSARVIGNAMGEMLKQSIVVENKAGGGGVLALELVKNAAPDGYTLMIAANSNATKPATIPKLPWDLEKDFAYIAVTTDATMVLVGNPERVPQMRLAELTAFMRANPERYAYGSCGIASTQHFAMEKYRFLTNAIARHVPYKGCAVATPEVLSGQLDMALVTLSNALPHIKSGKLRAFGVTTASRSPAAPDVPTIRESGIPELKNYLQESWYGFAAPAGTPKEIIDRLTSTIERAMVMPSVTTKLREVGLEPIYRDPQQTRAMMKSEVESFTQLTKAAGIKAE
jgi:tripartite-type tricarboxylate transporter receptor subunit TctC